MFNSIIFRQIAIDNLLPLGLAYDVMVRCEECGTCDDFEYGDGTGYCRVCGTQSQDIREEVVDADETQQFMNTTRRIRVLDTTKMAAPERIWTNAEALLIVLNVQVDALVAVGCPTELHRVAGELWFEFLAKLGLVVVPGTIPVMLNKPYKISIFDNFLILYLSLVNLNYPITLSHIVRWITTGVLCYFNATSLLPSYFKPPSLLRETFTVAKIPTTAALAKRLTIIVDVFEREGMFDISRCVPGIAKDLCEHYVVPYHDVQLVMLGLFRRFYNRSNQAVAEPGSYYSIMLSQCSEDVLSV
eukprot:sb/3467334/